MHILYKQIEDFFKIRFHYVSSREYRSESSIVNVFFKTFFVYGLPWEGYDKEFIERLKNDWIIKIE